MIPAKSRVLVRTAILSSERGTRRSLPVPVRGPPTTRDRLPRVSGGVGARPGKHSHGSGVLEYSRDDETDQHERERRQYTQRGPWRQAHSSGISPLNTIARSCTFSSTVSVNQARRCLSSNPTILSYGIKNASGSPSVVFLQSGPSALLARIENLPSMPRVLLLCPCYPFYLLSRLFELQVAKSLGKF